ncbi:helix-turn-helix domain-containing protein [Flavobacterium sp.]|uniref:helix-turn-helix domain-containing protein n=1 Tax=Flavobacterium sp. TaxID=239 RepID=UPI00286D8155|nr:helix-turn-helix domain-containing protein [Flavobacterium sp.]
MSKEILQLENINANDFKNEIVKDVTNALKGYAETLQNPDNNKLLTRQETAELLSVSLVTLWDWTKKDILPAYRIGNKVRYKKSEILLALQQMNKFSS